jgi:hypothetical protein
MDLNRGTLARIDRQLLAGLGQDETFQMVRVPVTAATWSTWKRYCDAAGISMGRAIRALIDRELVSVFGEPPQEEVLLLAVRAGERLAAREAKVALREREANAADKRLRIWEAELETREQRTELVSNLAFRPRVTNPKVGRNEQCPCGSGLKHKRCHGR